MFLVFSFCFYSFIGWVGDTAVRSVLNRRYTTGSFFPVPFCPVYGFGALLVILSQRFFGSWPILAQGAVYGLLLAGLEAGTGIFILGVFKRRLWNYANGPGKNVRFTDLWHVILWGALALLLITFVHPALVHLMNGA